MKFGVVIFPGSNCDRDCYWAVSRVLGQEAKYLWYQERDLSDLDCVILPGGFSFGDYLRAGALVRFSPVMEAVREYASRGGLVIGICNGFQILLEAGLLPGAMMRNRNLRFICEYVHIRVERTDTPFTCLLKEGEVLKIPIAHMEGNYFADEATLAGLKANNQVVFRYCSPEGDVFEEYNPNGSLENIAGICNEAGNVLGMMPHPERCCEALLGSEDGRRIFQSIVSHLSGVMA
ncbi:MAG: phosphoribosylformylglycinamidine synthase I [Aquificota bacterium]|nr:MAG: phosphoribosylformylglycinamidine synthase I [Aquificota bacterium]